jgi:hypothetical protein
MADRLEPTRACIVGGIVQLCSGVCCQFVNSGLAPASYIFFFILVSVFGSRDGQDVTIYRYKGIDIMVLLSAIYIF